MNNPLILITAFYILGIIINQIIPLSFWISFIFLAALLPSTIIRAAINKDTRFLILLIFLIIGLFNSQIRSLPPGKNAIAQLPLYQPISILGWVEDEPKVVKDQIFFTLRVEGVDGRKIDGLVSVKSENTKLEYGDKIEIKGRLEEINGLSNPAITSYADYLESKGIIRQCKVFGLPQVIGHGGNRLVKFSNFLRERLTVIHQKTLPAPYATLLSSIVFGSQASGMPAEIKEIYKKAGVSHLLVASGMNVSILVGVCLFIVRQLNIPLGFAFLGGSLVNLIYSMIAGGGPSVLRAAIMAEIMLIGLLFERDKEVFSALALSALVILLYDPGLLFDAGFQLSFAATWALVYVAPVLAEKLKKHIPLFFATTLAVSLSPFLASIPITLFHFSQFSLIGILTNILILPWVDTLVIMGFVSTLLGAIFLPLGELVNGANLILLWMAHFIVTSLARWPFAQIFVPPPTLALIMGYYAFLILGVEVLNKDEFPKLNYFKIITILLAILSVFFWNIILLPTNQGLTITMLDVGQGDSILIESPSGRKILIDSGEEPMGEKVVVPYLNRKGINRLDLVVLTHPHDDHLGGILPVLKKIKVEEVLDNGMVYETETYRRFISLLKSKHIKQVTARAGQMLNFGGGASAYVLSPFYSAVRSDNPNNDSIVFRLAYGGFSMLFTGDLEKEREEKLNVFKANYLRSTVLKVGHHGSATSTSQEFLDKVSPKIALISVGRHNRFRHPNKSTLERLKNMRIFRTDQDGAIIINTDGEKYEVRVNRPSRYPSSHSPALRSGEHGKGPHRLRRG